MSSDNTPENRTIHTDLLHAELWVVPVHLNHRGFILICIIFKRMCTLSIIVFDIIDK